MKGFGTRVVLRLGAIVGPVCPGPGVGVTLGFGVMFGDGVGEHVATLQQESVGSTDKRQLTGKLT